MNIAAAAALRVQYTGADTQRMRVLSFACSFIFCDSRSALPHITLHAHPGASLGSGARAAGCGVAGGAAAAVGGASAGALCPCAAASASSASSDDTSLS